MAEGGPKTIYNLTLTSLYTPYIAINHPLLTSIIQELGKVTNSLAVWEIEVVFSQTCTEVRGYPETKTLPEGAHPEAPPLRHATENGVLITF